MSVPGTGGGGGPGSGKSGFKDWVIGKLTLADGFSEEAALIEVATSSVLEPTLKEVEAISGELVLSALIDAEDISEEAALELFIDPFAAGVEGTSELLLVTGIERPVVLEFIVNSATDWENICTVLANQEIQILFNNKPPRSQCSLINLHSTILTEK